ncbi:MAG: type VI secretion system tube protein Hcp [Gammaproteobacteria bacterium]|nr:type VI secretion system tube protein Hcp [Gammaproteobacteria bacterium]
MSHFAVEMTNIPGEETLTDFAGQITCQGMSHGIDLPVVAKGTDRTDGASLHGSVVLEREIDSATPLLREACARSLNIADVTITRIKMVGAQIQPADIVKLKTVKVVQVFLDTPVDPATGQPSDQPVEFIVLDYEEIKWEHKVYANGVATDTLAGSYDTTTMTRDVSIA